jgi:hypothetical protein
LVCLLVTNPEQAEKDVGDVAGVIATSVVDEIVALDADCVFYAPVYVDLGLVQPKGLVRK